MQYTVTDEELLAGCLAADRKSQELLYRRYAGKMFAVCLRYEPDKDAASDILQDAFVKIFKALGNFKSQGSLEGWIRRIVVRTALDSLRKQSRMYVVADYDAFPLEETSPNAVQRLGEQELLGMVQSLAPGYRTVFSLYAIEGFPHKEIADMLGISEGTSKSQFARARAALQQMVEARTTPSMKKYETA